MQPTLIVREACEHNLRSVSLDLPHESLVAVSGPSGSGKTSLVLDTIYAAVHAEEASTTVAVIGQRWIRG